MSGSYKKKQSTFKNALKQPVKDALYNPNGIPNPLFLQENRR